MNQYDNTVYCKEPLGEYQGVPFFSIVDDYISNYEKIAHDHVTKATEKRSNPFTEESLLIELEESTVLLVKKYISAGDSILDVGVGLGRLLSRFDNVSKYGMDISWNYLLAAKNHGINVCFSLIEDIPYKEEYFDIIICTDVLEHVIDLNLAILNILKVLKPDGYLIIRVPYGKIYLCILIEITPIIMLT
jgi:2-polyprenyl-3-methyl-5-hydroxy-6-metoxy-1,4-benzoquinol methylase